MMDVSYGQGCPLLWAVKVHRLLCKLVAASPTFCCQGEVCCCLAPAAAAGLQQAVS